LRKGAEENIWAEVDEMMGGWRKLYNSELCDFCSLPGVIRMIKSRWMRLGLLEMFSGSQVGICVDE
jgi:hypothetical protein